MKTLNHQFMRFIIFLIIPAIISLQGCKKEEEGDDNNNNQNNQTTTTYSGTLALYFTNAVPPMYAEDKMDVFIDGDGNATIDNGSIQYSGDIVIEDDSKIERSGAWQLTPTGSLITQNGEPWLKINANIDVIEDIQRVYVKDNNGQWVLTFEIDMSTSPGSELAFPMDEAIQNELGAKLEVSNEMGSISWFLLLSENRQ